MKAVNGAQAGNNSQQVQRLAKQQQKQATNGGAGSFEDHVRQVVGGNGKNTLNEEELFAGTINNRLHSHKSKDAAGHYQAELKKQIKSQRRSGDGVSLEDAANKALKRTRKEGHISRKEAHRIRQESFQAAQLDNNNFRLYTGNGNRVAAADMTDALKMAQARVQSFDVGETRAQTKGERMTDYRLMKQSGEYALVAGNGNNTDGKVGKVGNNGVGVDGIKNKNIKKANPNDGGLGGFLFKPESDHGPLVVLLPKEFGFNVKSLTLKNKQGKVVEQGRSSGFANGNREHFRFNEPGREYPKNLTVEVTFNDNKKLHYNIKDPSQRYD